MINIALFKKICLIYISKDFYENETNGGCVFFAKIMKKTDKEKTKFVFTDAIFSISRVFEPKNKWLKIKVPLKESFGEDDLKLNMGITEN